MKWFKHFSSAHNDNALKKVRMRYGAEGYAVYWYCLELIAGDLDGHRSNFELTHDAEVIGHDLRIDQLKVEEIMVFMVEQGLFESSNNKITCLKLAKFIDRKSTRNPEIHAIIDRFNEMSPTVSDNPPTVSARLDKIRLDKDKGSCETGEPVITKKPAVPYQKIQELWAEILPNHPQPVKLTPARQSHIRARWSDELPDLDAWKECFTLISKSAFLTGKTKTYGGRKPFIATLDWIVKQDNLVKLYEGKYNG